MQQKPHRLYTKGISREAAIFELLAAIYNQARYDQRSNLSSTSHSGCNVTPKHSVKDCARDFLIPIREKIEKSGTRDALEIAHFIASAITTYNPDGYYNLRKIRDGDDS